MKYTDQTVIASVSGGKDSTAMCLHFKEQGIPYVPVFMDTGWENAKTYKYLKEYLPSVIGEITWLRPEVKLPAKLEPLALEFEEMLGHHSAMIRLVLKKGMFPSRIRRFCTQGLKIFPIKKYLSEHEDEVINAVGIRNQESFARSKMDEWEWNDTYDCHVWRPIIKFTEDDVIDIHTRHGVLPNPNYLAGAKRVGCWPCIYASKKELHHIAEHDDGRVEILTKLERAVTDLARARYEARGETFEGHNEPTWFQDPTSRKDPITGKRSGDTWPIAKVLDWARTKHGGKQYELFVPPMRDRGCMRWGLCDVAEDD